MKKFFWFSSFGVFIILTWVYFLKLTKPLQPNVAIAALAKHPLSFIENKGQLDSKVKFYLQAPNYSILFKEDAIIYSGGIQQKFIGAGAKTQLQSLKKVKGKVNYLIGKDQRKWKTGIPVYQEVVYQNLYPGIDLVFFGSEGKLKSEFRVAAGADYKKIVVVYEGLDDLRLSDAGDLVIQSKSKRWKEMKPFVYQLIDGQKVEMEGMFVLHEDQYVFAIPAYDPQYPLVIDPEIVYSTYLGGSSPEDGYNKIAVDIAPAKQNVRFGG